MKEEFLGPVEVVRSKVAEALANKIKNVFDEKGLDLCHMRFNKWREVEPAKEIQASQSKYFNCRNHKLALSLLHLLKNTRLKCLRDVDAFFLSV